MKKLLNIFMIIMIVLSSYNVFSDELKMTSAEILKISSAEILKKSSAKEMKMLSVKNSKIISSEKLKLTCLSGVLIDADTGRILYEKNADEKRAMASTTKIMTCILALEQSDGNEVVTVSENAEKMPRVKMYIKKGEQYYLKDLLYALMLESYNDVAVAVAEHLGGSIEGFAKRMNQKAKELGMTKTNFVTPNGLDAKNHFSTALDMARLGAYAIKNKRFLKIINTKRHTIKEIKNKRTITVYNKDAYLTMERDAIGIKTGFTNRAGYCFVGAVKSGNERFVSCVLASGWPPARNQKYIDTKKLMNYGKKHFKTEDYHLKRSYRLKLANGKNNRLYAKVTGKGKILKSNNEKIRYQTIFNYRLPVKKNQIIGQTKVFLDNFCLASFPIIAVNDVPVYDFRYCFENVVSRLFSF